MDNIKVIAIKDSPILPIGTDSYEKNGVYHERAYYKGDIFDVHRNDGWLIVYNHRIGINMDVNSDNFIKLEEWREKRLNELLKNDIE